MKQQTAIALCTLFLFSTPSVAEEPLLPMGLGNNTEKFSTEEDSYSWKENLPFELNGFTETRIGKRLHDDETQKNTSIGEARLHLEANKDWDNLTANITGDLLYDPVLSRHSNDLNSADGWIDLRTANITFSPTDFSDVKLGRQITTWGTGDLIFINDLFSKDWNSFFIGRDDEYLKAPTDAVKVALFGDVANLDIVYTPKFNSDRFIDGYRLSYYNGNTKAIDGRNNPVITDERLKWFKEDEISMRLNKLIKGYETSLYYYNGYWKNPVGQSGSVYTFPELTSYGASIRGSVAGGIANAEVGYYDSRSDDKGDDPLIRNSEFRFLVGFERELMPELNGSVQYYLEHMIDHSNYIKNLPAGAFPKDQNRHLITVRLTKLLMNQNLKLSFFNFYSPSDNDGYMRPKINYKIDDSWTFESGGNIFYGDKKETFFGQFKDNSNVYASLRYGF